MMFEPFATKKQEKENKRNGQPFTITVPQSHFLILLLEMNTKIEICKRSKTSVPVVSRSVKPEIPNES